ncbi:MAG: hypothetical protein F4X26_11025 [Chloroflexi bacterium]|nr:hypothetical protein [Chloroflexota bacterium]
MEQQQREPERDGRARSRPFESDAELEAFFRECDEIAGPEREPDWHEHVAVINEPRRSVSLAS